MKLKKVTDPDLIAKIDREAQLRDTVTSEFDNSNEEQEQPQMQQHSPEETQGWTGVGEDAINGLIGSILGIPSMIGSAPGEIGGALGQAGSDPKRFAQNIGAGLGEYGHKILNAPGNARDYLQRKGIVSENAPSFRLPESILPKEFNYGEGVGLQGQQEGDALIQGLPGLISGGLAGKAANISSKLPKISNKSFAKKLSTDKAAVTKEASAGYNQLFNDVRKELDIDRVKVPKINSANIIKNSQPKHHEALKKFLSEPTFENAHWAQSDLGFIERHLKKIDEKGGLSSQQHKVLKETMAARNRIKQAMFENKKLADNDVFKGVYDKLNADYAKNVVPYKQLEDLSKFENKKLTSKKLVNSLLEDDEFTLGLGKKYPLSLAAQKIKRSKTAKTVGGLIAADLGYHTVKGH